MEQNSNNQNQLMYKKCPACGREYPKKQRFCEKCDILLMRISEYERLNMEANRATLQKMLSENDNQKEQNIPKCPTCGSTNIEKISTTSKAIGFVAVGVFSSNFGKTMHCKNCGYKW